MKTRIAAAILALAAALGAAAPASAASPVSKSCSYYHTTPCP